ncbi:uncharacterized protein ASPGLDRAFT_39252 [Aspergillus glaucus CBS 516.65]|uniref:PD-(D/E)XK nuclease-like domain-containing protein n=1 Tax=Aspergillus glaucus CBS 516.65 TaxID=1160497 RepID=A0A1L9V8I5_ASPGL|nr:hypothetical protein ASPGLDRAFT_39252 [Aspergillus glaucus CBS 516.65]OJJ80256.1 hypothetical protein ASPGLDRAFT_39252 [Aspergillus glaucus CBS 516.65]
MALSSILAEPRIIYRLPPGIRCPESAISVRRELSKDFGMKLIPLEFKDKIEEADGEMPDFAYDDGDSLSPGQLETLWENIQEIYISRQQSVADSPKTRMLGLCKLQTIEPEILPRLPHHDLSDISSSKVNYVFALFPRSSEIGESLWWFERERIPLGLTTDPGLSFTPLFAGVIVRDTSGNLEEATLQLSLLFAAQFEKLIRLSKLQGKEISGYQLPLMFGWTVFGSDWHLYYAYRCIVGGKETMYVNKAIAAICPNTTTDLYYGIFKIIDLVRRVATYLENVHWPLLRDNILCPPVNLGVQA